MMRLVRAVLVCGWMAAYASAQQKTSAQVDAEAREADTLYMSGKTLATLPLYEDLHAQQPRNTFFTTRLAMAIVARGGAAGSAEAERSYDQKALDLFVEAKNGGDTSDLNQVMIARITAALAEPLRQTPTEGPNAAGGSFAKAEVLFSQGDLKAAAAEYKKSADLYPKFYSAPLYAGDSEYKLGNFDEAGVWFQRAIAINPDAETAHRYWADCLLKAGKPMEARRQYLLAYVGNPYDKAPGLQLRTFAKENHERWLPPVVSLPARPTRAKNGNINITMDPSKANDPMMSAWLMYNMNSASWLGDKFAKQYPKEKEYRHSLAEEVEGLHLVVTSLRAGKVPESKMDATGRTLLALDNDGMLECWVLLDHADNGVAQDYDAYRTAHRELMVKYVEKYDLHAGG